ncbi:MAG: hypothetical protein KJ709_01185 [Nanoarchaeota archaeon]|nr:hypothetical protein [Nanoarchaeota archaeon]
MDKLEILESLGFSSNDAKCYLSLLELGPSTVQKISDSSKVNRTNVYDCLKRLQEKGIVSTFVKTEKRYFEACDPELLINILKEKEIQLCNILPELRLKRDLAAKSEAHVYEGVVAVRNMLNHMNDLGKTRYAYGSPFVSHKILGDFFLERYHRERVKKKIKFYMIYNSDADVRIDFLNKLNYTEARFLPPEYDSPVTTSICGDEVVFFLYADKPQVIQIKNKEMAKAYRNYFKILWKKARKG